ncbi:Crp/Fnr family transcriptional regulator [Ethanoligenens harbinense]|uniref:Transcriptional regulator, Crp/Fnr family n=1 Tax=Ethanoligenens harbinense (strain DSM 18485 / JCM 12961 / CGMCC 1.5033 / YUAN-3) TaxID=663278 RepID=E6U9B3_ETHHY|nr:Crp/Fnr family transcriptional regulator [Ethanoligenens harbinense]ADU27272.1 transcriptional regulator, Crp/Fnr family [Ethanoligenens harbinense YUAN-3]AVQ96337.1 Crp/Fnr family transcriptional regulator [Ethanoligenens harbinense YUAN-3]AYF38995.1 Crp/Fnr family transcriptional regulator [Ethanoligenens harbinense]AYF41748.1 Crp/Fnr family transcriptional regulator [Ethanoligenens harbinense]QCN92578.1 Crp/Fnr family transcriptional regulator [Ethanoligenens harbinense]
MQNDLTQIAAMPVFEHIRPEELEKLLPCLGARIRSAVKGEIVLLAGEPVDSVGLLLAGSAQIAREDEAGNRNMLGRVEPGELFAEMFACLGMAHSPVTVTAETDVRVLFLNFHRIIYSCTSACAFHSRLVENMLHLFARKTLALNEKLDCVGRRTLHEKVHAFLAQQREHGGGNPFTIPFSRAEMADYLCVDRSALSAILSRMKRAGEIDYRKNRFRLLDGFYR